MEHRPSCEVWLGATLGGLANEASAPESRTSGVKVRPSWGSPAPRRVRENALSLGFSGNSHTLPPELPWGSASLTHGETEQTSGNTGCSHCLHGKGCSRRFRNVTGSRAVAVILGPVFSVPSFYFSFPSALAVSLFRIRSRDRLSLKPWFPPSRGLRLPFADSVSTWLRGTLVVTWTSQSFTCSSARSLGCL